MDGISQSFHRTTDFFCRLYLNEYNSKFLGLFECTRAFQCAHLQIVFLIEGRRVHCCSIILVNLQLLIRISVTFEWCKRRARCIRNHRHINAVRSNINLMHSLLRSKTRRRRNNQDETRGYAFYTWDHLTDLRSLGAKLIIHVIVQCFSCFHVEGEAMPGTNNTWLMHHQQLTNNILEAELIALTNCSISVKSPFAKGPPASTQVRRQHRDLEMNTYDNTQNQVHNIFLCGSIR